MESATVEERFYREEIVVSSWLVQDLIPDALRLLNL